MYLPEVGREGEKETLKKSKLNGYKERERTRGRKWRGQAESEG